LKKLVRSSVKDIKEYVPGKSIEEIANRYGLKPDSIIKLAQMKIRLVRRRLQLRPLKKKQKSPPVSTIGCA